MTFNTKLFSTPVLYILMRTDLASMNPGKAMAQAAHAANAFIFNIDTDLNESNSFKKWESSTPQGFGTTIVLGGSWDNIANTILEFQRNYYEADVVHDPTYPLVDGSVVHLIPLNTCGYVFVEDKEGDEKAKQILSNYLLHP